MSPDKDKPGITASCNLNFLLLKCTGTGRVGRLIEVGKQGSSNVCHSASGIGWLRPELRHHAFKLRYAGRRPCSAIASVFHILLGDSQKYSLGVESIAGIGGVPRGSPWVLW